MHEKLSRDDAQLRVAPLVSVDGRVPADPVSGVVALSVREWGAQWLDAREREGVRSVRDDRSRWRTHVDPAPWAALPLADVTRAQARAWLTELCERRKAHRYDEPGEPHRVRQPLAAQTLRNVLNLVRRAFGDAMQDGAIDSNPFDGLRVRRSRAASTGDRWTVLRPEEQTKALAALAPHERLMAQFALGTGLRQGEQMALRLCDLALDGPDRHIVVRFGRFGKPTKSGKPRRVPLFGLALAALLEWLPELPRFCRKNPHGLVFPNPNGTPRGSRPCARFEVKVQKAIGRRMRWHDWRHTCASSLVAGWWGPAWSLEEVRVLLGHSTVRITERYAHFAHDVVTRAAARMRSDDGGGEPPPDEESGTVETMNKETVGRTVAVIGDRIPAAVLAAVEARGLDGVAIIGGGAVAPELAPWESGATLPLGEPVGEPLGSSARVPAPVSSGRAETRAKFDFRAEGDEGLDTPIPFCLGAVSEARTGLEPVCDGFANRDLPLPAGDAPVRPCDDRGFPLDAIASLPEDAQRRFLSEVWLEQTLGERWLPSDAESLAALLNQWGTHVVGRVADGSEDEARRELVRVRESLVLREAQVRALERVHADLREATGLLTDLDALADRTARLLDRLVRK